MVEAELGSCSHCGLRAPAGQRFCCFGCELCYRIRAEGRDDHAGLLGRLSFTLVLAMIVMMLALFLYAEDVFDASGDVEMAWMRSGYRWASFVLATPVMAIAGGPLAASAARQLRRGRLSMDALITLGAFAAYALSTYALFAGRTGIYFDSATAAVVLATFGRSLEATARSKASRTLGPLIEVTRGTVRWLKEPAPSVAISAAEVEPGMRIEISAGQVVPVDMRLEHAAEFDLAIINGESRPVAVERGATVPAGAIPLTPKVEGIALRASRHSALERLAQLARGLVEASSPRRAWADRFAAALTPTIAFVAACTVGWWTRQSSLEAGVIAGLAVVLSACPCSYSIASPLVHWLMLKTAFCRGVLVRSTHTFEELARTRVMAFDKTGTLTRSELSVTGATVSFGADRDEVLSLVRSLEEANPHPIAAALGTYAGPGAHAVLRERRFLAGKGVDALDDRGRKVSLHAGKNGSIVLERERELLAAFELDEQLRPEAKEAVDALGRDGVRVVLLSGDAEQRVGRVGRALGIEAHARLTPPEKVRCMEALGDGTAMVGDGLNDAPALALGRASFALGDATQLAKGIAQVTLLQPDLRLIPFTLALARRGRRHVQWLIGSSTAYNVVFVGLAAAGTLKPVWAGLSMLISSLLAVGFAAVIGDGDSSTQDSLELVESTT